MKLSDVTETVLAIIVVGGIVVIAVYETINGKPLTIPGELLGFGGLVLGSYFRGRATNGTIANLTSALQQSVPADAVKPPNA